MKKRILTFVFALCMVVSLAVPAFAVQQMYDYGGLEATDFRNVVDMETYPYALVAGENLYVCTSRITYDTGGTGEYAGYIYLNTSFKKYVFQNNEWVYVSGSTAGKPGTTSAPTWTNHDLYNAKTYELFLGAMGFELMGVDFEDWGDYYGALTKQITVKNVVSVVVVGVTAVVGIVFLWWGVRKLIRALMTAFRKGRVSL